MQHWIQSLALLAPQKQFENPSLFISSSLQKIFKSFELIVSINFIYFLRLHHQIWIFLECRGRVYWIILLHNSLWLTRLKSFESKSKIKIFLSEKITLSINQMQWIRKFLFQAWWWLTTNQPKTIRVKKDFCYVKLVSW